MRQDPLLKSLGVDLPREIVHRPKRGFTLPFERWMRGELRLRIEQALQRESVRYCLSQPIRRNRCLESLSCPQDLVVASVVAVRAAELVQAEPLTSRLNRRRVLRLSEP